MSSRPASGSVVPTLTDGVVTLRAHVEDDIPGALEQCQDPLSQQWTTVPVPYTLDHAKQFVRHAMPGGWVTDQEWAFAIEAVDPSGEPRFGGTVSLRNEAEGRAEIAYGSHPWIRGRGYVERALRLLLDWGFGDRGLHTVIWWANQGNWASRKVAWRLGFSFDGTVRRWLPQRGELLDAWVGTLLRGDELAPRNAWLEVPRILGERVVLRAHRPDDADRVVEACTDERTIQWLGQLPQPYTRETAEEFLRNRPEGMARGTDLHWAIAEPGTDLLLGVVSLMHIGNGRNDQMAEVGYWAHPGARGRGVMTEAVRLAARHAFVDEEDGGLGLHRLTGFAAVDNTASRHVLEAAGFTQFGTERQAILVRDGWHDCAGYDLLR
ncbi:MAG TPA: GNAT family N-acetyltransferase [Marmoricola sp.]|nr:GNAT family N-acetyltransferase [Marmoricola sp.]